MGGRKGHLGQMAPGANEMYQIIVFITKQLKGFDGPREVIWGRWPLGPNSSFS